MQLMAKRGFHGLNPCCGGRCSSTFKNSKQMKKINKVLILVVVEDVLVQTVTVLSASGITVLILVVVEDVLVQLFKKL